MNTCENTDIQMIQSQCGVSLKEAVELYTESNQNVVQAISFFLNPALRQEKQDTKKVDKTQQALNQLRTIANKKDKMFSDFIQQSKMQNTPQQSESSESSSIKENLSNTMIQSVSEPETIEDITKPSE